MPEVLIAGLALPSALLGFTAVAMMFYTLIKAMGAATIEENRRWKRRYYKWMASFIFMWVFMMILLKSAGRWK
jgi:Na+/pantothenate symporter